MTRLVSAAMQGWIAGFAAWAVWTTAGIFLRAPLASVAAGLPLCLLAGVVTGWRDYRQPIPQPAIGPGWAAPGNGALLATLLAAGAIASLPFAGAALLQPCWGIAAAAMLAVVVMRENKGTAPIGPEAEERDGGPLKIALLATAMVLALGVTILSNRSDADDYRYLWMAVHPAHHPDVPILHLFQPRFEINPGATIHVYTLHPYEILAASIAFFTGWPAEWSYYYVLPPLNAILTVTELYLGARLFLGRDAAWAVPLAVLLLVAWGQTHRDIGNFAFVRLFQGKALLVSWALPAVFRFAVRAGRERTPVAALPLVAAMLAAFGTTHVGIALAPLAAAIGLFAGWPSGGALVTLCLSGGAAALLWGAAIQLPRIVPLPETHTQTEVYTALSLVFPADIRSMLILGSSALASLVLPPPARRLAARALAMALIMAINPFVMALLSHIVPSLKWRALWPFPFTLFASVCLVAAARAEMARWRLPLFTGLALVLFLTSGNWTIAEANGNHFGDLGLKADDTLKSWLSGNTDERIPREVNE